MQPGSYPRDHIIYKACALPLSSKPGNIFILFTHPFNRCLLNFFLFKTLWFTISLVVWLHTLKNFSTPHTEHLLPPEQSRVLPSQFYYSHSPFMVSFLLIECLPWAGATLGIETRVKLKDKNSFPQGQRDSAGIKALFLLVCTQSWFKSPGTMYNPLSTTKSKF